jgi:hypothetical protein
MKQPRLRTVEKSKAPYPINQFPPDFAINLAKEIVYLLATRGESRLEGSDWEEVFARVIHAEWKPSNVGLDDIVLGQCAWGAKTLKSPHPSQARSLRLISGRNSPVYSYGDESVANREPSELGGKILTIWNERVSAVREKYKHLRTIVLVKSDDLLELVVFEFETIRFDLDQYSWEWNQNRNLVGHDLQGKHRFTWQPHGSQFTIIEDVPSNRLALRIKQPPIVDRESVLNWTGFDKTWVEIL